MLTLVCGAATGFIRRALLRDILDTRGASGTLVVVPDADWALNLTTTLARSAGGLRCQAVIGLPDLIDLLRPAETRLIIEPRERLVILRSIIYSDPPAYDMLVGERSAPHLTLGVLQRIADAATRAMDRNLLAAEGGEEPPPPSAREKQLLHLEREYRRRLEASQALDRRTADREACLAIVSERVRKLMPGIDRIVFAGFDTFSDLTLLALRRFRDAMTETFVLLNFDPLQDADHYSHLAEQYPRIFDLADRTLSETPGGTAVAEQTEPAQSAIKIVRAHSRRQEARAIARYLRTQLEHDTGQLPGNLQWDDYLLIVPAYDKYYPLLQERLAEYSIPVSGAARMRVFDHPGFHLLEHLRGALAGGRSFASIRQLLKSPFLRPVLSRGETTASSLPQLHVLDRLRREGALSGETKLLLLELAEYQAALSEKQEATDASENAHDSTARVDRVSSEVAALHDLIEQVFALLTSLENEAALTEWPERLEELLTSARAVLSGEPQGGSHSQLDRFDGVSAQLRVAANRLAACNSLMSPGPVSFVAYVAMIRVMLGYTQIEEPKSKYGIDIVDRWEGQGRRPRVVLICGMVDGEFPQYAQREASLEDTGGMRPNQQANLARQRYLFDSYLKSAREQVILLCPQFDDGAELLESQFVEELLDSSPGIEVIAANDFCEAYQPAAMSSRDAMRELSRRIQIQLDIPTVTHSRSDRGEIAGTHSILQNIAWNVAANYERARPDALGLFDGFISDPTLLDYLQRRLAAHVHSVSQLDVLVQCPFRYMIQYVMNLQELEEPEEGIDPRDLGKLAHDILFRFMVEWTAMERGAIQPSDRSEALELLSRHAERALRDQRLPGFSRDLLRFKLFGSSEESRSGVAGKEAPRLRDFPGLLAAFVDLEISRYENSGGSLLNPAYFEMGFGLKATRGRDGTDEYSMPEPVSVNLGDETIRLRGRADRVDVGTESFAIIDYKTGATPSIKDQTEGYRVQIPAYLMALEQVFESRGRYLAPAGGMFYGLRAESAEVIGQLFRKALRQEGGLGSRVRALEDDDFNAVLDLVRWRIADGLKRVRTGRFHVTLADEKIACSYCSSATICRKDLARAERLVSLADISGGHA